MANLVYGDVTVDHANVPLVSLVALAQRGLNHVMQNEVASKVIGEIRKAINPDKPSDVTTEAVKAYRAAHEEAIAELENKFRGERWADINEGRLGVTVVRGPKVDPLTAEMRKIAGVLVRKQLAANGLKLKDSKVVIGGNEFTLAQLVDRRIARDGALIEREAKAELAEVARRMARIEKAATETANGEGDLMGF